MSKMKKLEYVLLIFLVPMVALLLLATTQIKEKKYFPLETDHNVQLLFLGDSNMAYDFEGVSIPGLFDEIENYSIYNIAIGGSCAAKLNTAGNPERQEDLYGLYHLAKIARTGNSKSLNVVKDGNNMDEIRKIECLSQIDMSKMDYIIISYGLNDYMAGVVTEGEDDFDETTYCGALRSGIRNLQTVSDATIVLASVTYATYPQEDGTFLDGYTKDYGGGTIDVYRDAAQKVAGEFENVVFFDALSELGIDASNYENYMRDIIHFNQNGRDLYAEALMKVIEEN